MLSVTNLDIINTQIPKIITTTKIIRKIDFKVDLTTKSLGKPANMIPMDFPSASLIGIYLA